MKHNGSLSDSFPISNGVQQGCVLAPTLFSVFFRLTVRPEFVAASEKRLT